MPLLPPELRAARLLAAATAATLLLCSLSSPALAQVRQGATMTVLQGQVAVVRPDGSAIQPAPSGTTVFAGDEIRTLTPGGALITFFSGIEIEMGEGTVLAIEQVSRQGESVQVSLKEVFGVAMSRVQTLADPNSSYQVQLGGVAAVARGTVGVGAVEPPFAGFYSVQGTFGLYALGDPSKPRSLIRELPAGVGVWWRFDPKTGQIVTDLNEFGLPNRSPWDVLSILQEEDIKENKSPPNVEGNPEDDYSGYQGPPVSAAELLARRLSSGLDPLSASGTLLALGMIGWTFHDWRPRRRR